MHKTELLAPAGSRESFLGALSAGADAFYLAGQKFGARAYADNFTEEELVRTIREAHIFGRKIYLTVNTLTREDELAELTAYVRRLYLAGLDGVIVQDLGVIDAIREACPGLLLHASTQLSVTSAESVRLLKKLGVCRVVPARELSLRELEQLRREEEIEIEAFIHGAMCYSYSGRCLLSGFLGGRSGNRGRCAGTCRLPFRILDEDGKPALPDGKKKEYYPLSMKDMSVLTILPELMDAGIDSFKIEGRMKKPEYAAGVTAIYRKYIDYFSDWDRDGRKTPWKVDERDLDQLRSLYIRTGIGTGYYHTKNGRGLITIDLPGYAGSDERVLEEVRSRYLDHAPQRPVSGFCRMAAGEPAQLTLLCGGAAVTVSGQTVQPAVSRPSTAAQISERLRKTGGSLFYLESLEMDCGEDIFIPNGAVNALRREALQQLEDAVLAQMPEHDRNGQRSESGTAPEKAREMTPAVPEKMISETGPETAAETGPGTTAEAAVETGPGTAAETAVETGPGTAERAECLPEADRQRRAVCAHPVWAMVTTQEQLDAAAASGADRIITDAAPHLQVPAAYRDRICHAMPPVLRMEYRDRLAPYLQADRVMVRNLEELGWLREHGFRGEITADASLYQWNSRAVSLLRPLTDRTVLSLELTAGQILQVPGLADPERAVLTVYGRLPLMVSAGCIRKTEGRCLLQTGGRAVNKDGHLKGEMTRATLAGDESFWSLKDRKGARFPVRSLCRFCSSIMYNSVPLSLHQYLEHPIFERTGPVLLSFTIEPGVKTAGILDWFGAALTGRQAGTEPPLQNGYTGGHFRKGVL